MYLAAAIAATAAAAVPLALTREEGSSAGAGGAQGSEDPYSVWHRAMAGLGGRLRRGWQQPQQRAWVEPVRCGIPPPGRQCAGVWMHPTGPAAQALAPLRAPRIPSSCQGRPPTRRRRRRPPRHRLHLHCTPCHSTGATTRMPLPRAWPALPWHRRGHRRPPSPPLAACMEMLAELHQQLSTGTFQPPAQPPSGSQAPPWSPVHAAAAGGGAAVATVLSALRQLPADRHGGRFPSTRSRGPRRPVARPTAARQEAWGLP